MIGDDGRLRGDTMNHGALSAFPVGGIRLVSRAPVLYALPSTLAVKEFGRKMRFFEITPMSNKT
jgi:hypothetical protein